MKTDKSFKISSTTVYEKNGRYYGMIKYYDENGKLKSKSVNLNMFSVDSHGRDNKEKARKQIEKERRKFSEVLLQEKRTSIAMKESDKNSHRVDWGNLKFHDAIKLWLDKSESDYQKSTFSSMRNYVRRTSEYFSQLDIYVDEVKGSDLADFYDWLRKHPFNKQGKPPTENTIRHYHNIIHKFFQFCVQHDIIDYNPADKLNKPKIEKTEASFYSEEQIKQLLTLFEGTLIYPCVVMASHYGLRRSEIAGLQWSDIDFEKKIIHIRHKMVDCKIDGERILELSDKMKNESSKRDLPLLDNTAEILKREKEQQKALNGKNKEYEDFVFRDNEGLPIKPSTITDMFRKIVKKSNMPKITFHQLRHSFASILLHNNIDIKVIQTLLGHSSFQTTADIYAHCFDEAKDRAMATIENIF